MTLIVFLLILSILVLVHEFGHFYAAKKNNVLVEEFGLGMPPSAYKKKVGETVYALNWLPFGGYVKLFGEDEADGSNVLTNPRSFLAKSPLQRAVIIVAGVVMNLLLAVVLYYVFFMFTGFKTFTLPILFDYKFKFGETLGYDTVVVGFLENTPAEQAGINFGEAIVAIDNIEVKTVTEIKEYLVDKENKVVDVTVLDMKDPALQSKRIVSVTPIKDDNGNNILGVYMGSAAQLIYKNKLLAPFSHSYNVISYSFSTMGKFISESISTKSAAPVSQGVSGPIGIYSVVGSILSIGGSQAILTLLDFTALISLSLALMNIMPFPALDGGRLVFIIVEVLTGKRVNLKFEAAVHKYGIIFFLGLLVLVSIKDLGNIFGN